MADLNLTGSGSVGRLSSGWKITDDATPIAIGDSSGSVGGGKLVAARRSDSDFVANNELRLEHDELGTFVGRIAEVGLSGLEAQMSVSGLPEFLNVTVTAPPLVEFEGSQSAFGSPGSGNGQFDVPAGVAVGPDGNVYVADRSNNRVQVFSSSGTYVTKWGTSGSGDGQFNGPEAIGVDSSGRVFVGDAVNFRVQVFSSSGTFITKWGSFGFGPGQFFNITSLAVDSVGNVWVCDDTGVQNFTASGTLLNRWSVESANPSMASGARGIAVDSRGYVYVSTIDDDVRKYNPDGSLLLSWGSSGTGNGQFDAPQGLAVDLQGNILVVDSGNHRVQMFSPEGEYLKQWGSQGSGTTAYDFPHGAGVSSTGVLYVTDFGNNRIRISNPYGGAAQGVLLSDVFQRYVDIVALDHPVTYSASSNPRVIYPGWRDRAWVKLKELAAANNVEFRAVGDTLEVVDVASSTLDVTRKTPPRVTPKVQGGARTLKIVNQHTTGGADQLMYQADRIYTVGIGSIETVVLTTTNHPLTLNTPSGTSTLPAPTGTFYVQDSTGAHVSAALFSYYGGGVFATPGANPGQIELTLQGPKSIIPGFTAPFSFASGTGVSRTPQLSISGSGVLTSPETVTVYTGADPRTQTQESAATIDNPFISSTAELYDRGVWASSRATGVDVTVQFEMAVHDLAGFGLDKGSVFPYNDSFYRIVSVQYGNLRAVITASKHVTVGDVKAAFGGWTNGEVKTFWAGFTNGDVKIKPFTPVASLSTWLFPATDLFPSTSLYPGDQS